MHALATALVLLHGVVMRGPTMPVCQVGLPCSAPAPGAVLVFSRDGQIVAFVQRLENESGTLHISLERPPGAAPVSGTGNLVTLMLARGMKNGDSTIRITEFRVRDPQQNVATGPLAEVRVLAP